MNTNRSEEEIYELLEQFSFEQLDKIQQEKVLRHLDEETYTQMHNAFKVLTGANQPQGVRGKAQIKREIFDSANNQKSEVVLFGFLHRSVSLGRVAILVLPLIAALLWSLLREPSMQYVETTIQATDTLYIAKNKVVQEVISDTVYSYVKQPKPAHVQRRKALPAVSSQAQDELQPGVPGLHVVSTAEINAATNQSKNNSLEHDSLAKKFRFVSL